MKRLGLLPLLLLLLAGPARAALDADLILVYGSQPVRLLPTYAAAAKAPPRGSDALAKLPPVIAWAEGEEKWTQAMIERIAPRKTVWIAPPEVSPDALQIPGKVQRIVADDAAIGAAIAEAAFSPSDAPRAVWVSGAEAAEAIVASALAAAGRSPLLVSAGHLDQAVREAGVLAERLGAKEVVVVGEADHGRLASRMGIKVRVLTAADALRSQRTAAADANHLVLVAPADAKGPFSPSKLSLASVPYLLAKGAALAYVGAGPGGGQTPEEATARLEAEGLGRFDYVSLVGDWLAIPMREIEDVDQVARGVKKPRVHKIPPFVDPEGAPSDRAVGRLTALDVYDLSRWVARLANGIRPLKGQDSALVFANAHDIFILGETISRSTSAELANAGVRVDSFYRDQITKERIEKELPRHGLVLWEGHPTDLTVGDDAIPVPANPLAPGTVFLQGCYTFDKSDPYLFIERGANAVLGTYMAVYSSSGSAFARAYLNAQIHAGATDGEAMASARNYLLAVVELKKRRGHKDWRKTLRAALSFDLWGDPEARAPVSFDGPKQRAVTTRLAGERITMRIPPSPLPKADTERYFANVRPGGILAGLYNFVENEEGEVVDRRLSELFYAEVELPPSFGDDPVVEAPYPDETYAWLFSPADRKLALIVHEQALPAIGAAATLQFTVSASPAPPAATAPTDG